MVYFYSDYLQMEYYSAQRVLISQWYASCNSLQYRNALIKFLRLTRDLGIKYAVNDQRLLPSLSEDDLNWTLDVYLRSFCEVPLQRFAIVNPFDAEASRQTKSILHNKHHQVPFETHIFEDLTSAYDWLLNGNAK